MSKTKCPDPRIGRRGFMRRSLGAAAGLCVAAPAPAAFITSGDDRVLSFLNLHTNERLECCYWSGGRYDASALDDIAQVLRDHRADEATAMSRELLDLLVDLQRRLDTAGPYHVISGYRSPSTNARLRARGSGVAKKSFHMFGMAIDVRLPDVALAELRRTALAMKAGGVGYYPKSGFVHLDVGRPRFW